MAVAEAVVVRPCNGGRRQYQWVDMIQARNHGSRISNSKRKSGDYSYSTTVRKVAML